MARAWLRSAAARIAAPYFTNTSSRRLTPIIVTRPDAVPRVVFKGGTLLRVCYRHDWRFSEDLDFDWVHADDSKQAIHDFFSRDWFRGVGTRG